ncbi:hypothetical protein BGX20_002030 [Mortierella sp. AD010]|nr:hypothetical protein BGX20_002030 [Mortierella sp. AD010]
MAQHSKNADVYQLYSRILGDPQPNVESAISTFVQEFETRRPLLSIDKTTVNMLKEGPTQLQNAKTALDAGLEGTGQKSATATQLAKEAFQKDIAEAKEAFDQEMALRHADVVKQYVGAFVQQIDHY